MAKVALRFGCAKQSKNLERYLINSELIKVHQVYVLVAKTNNAVLGMAFSAYFFIYKISQGRKSVREKKYLLLQIRL